MSWLQFVTVVVADYDTAIDFYVRVLGFELVDDSPTLSSSGALKRWVVVRPRGAQTALLLAQADGDEQLAAMGHQVGNRVGFFLQVDEFEATYERIQSFGVEIESPVRRESYGNVAVFRDIAGNRWDLIETPDAKTA